MSPWSHEKFSRPIIKKQFRDAVNEFPLLQGKKLQSACSLFHLQIMVDFKCLPKRRVIWFTILSIFFWIHFFPKTKTKPPPIKLMTGHFLKPSIPQAPNSCERRIICERPKKRMKTMWKRVTRNLSKINLSMMWSKKAVFNVYTHIFIHIYIYMLQILQICTELQSTFVASRTKLRDDHNWGGKRWCDDVHIELPSLWWKAHAFFLFKYKQVKIASSTCKIIQLVSKGKTLEIKFNRWIFISVSRQLGKKLRKSYGGMSPHNGAMPHNCPFNKMFFCLSEKNKKAYKIRTLKPDFPKPFISC